MPEKVSATFPFRIVSPNVQEHWTKRHKRNKKQALILWGWWNGLGTKPQPPCIVTITRIAPKSFDDDNMTSAAKGLRDILADLLRPGFAPGQADGKVSGISWVYTQEKGLPKQYLLRIEITPSINHLVS